VRRLERDGSDDLAARHVRDPCKVETSMPLEIAPKKGAQRGPSVSCAWMHERITGVVGERLAEHICRGLYLRDAELANDNRAALHGTTLASPPRTARSVTPGATDRLGEARALPPVQRGDLLAIFTTGAYGMVMASQYNAVPRPPEVLISSGESLLFRRQETYEDLVLAELETRAI
jgi:hypothetical protein